MATYAELYDLGNNSDLKNKVSVAAVKFAQSILDLATPTYQQVTYANKLLSDPINQAAIIYRYVLGANSSATVSQITSATDSTIQTNTTAACTKLLTLERTSPPA